MVSPAEPRGSEPVDPAFASLFRPEDDDVPAAPAGPTFSDASDNHDMTDDVVDVAALEPDFYAESADQAAEAEAEPEPAVAEPVIVEPSVDTGRLFRSQGVSDRPDAVLALSSDHFGRLRTLSRSDTPSGPATGIEPAVIPIDSTALGSAVVIDDEDSLDDSRRGRRARRKQQDRPDPGARVHRRGRREITAGAVYILVIGITVAAAFADALLHDGDLGWLTGLAMAIVSIYCALFVTRDDDVVAIYTPPIAFLVAALTAGQLFLGQADKSLINRAVVVFFDLADNWHWVIGTTLVVVIIVAVRRRRA